MTGVLDMTVEELARRIQCQGIRVRGLVTIAFSASLRRGTRFGGG